MERLTNEDRRSLQQRAASLRCELAQLQARLETGGDARVARARCICATRRVGAATIRPIPYRSGRGAEEDTPLAIAAG